MTTYYLRHKASGTFVNACDTSGSPPRVLWPAEGYEWVPESQLTLDQMRTYEREVYPGND